MCFLCFRCIVVVRDGKYLYTLLYLVQDISISSSYRKIYKVSGLYKSNYSFPYCRFGIFRG